MTQWLPAKEIAARLGMLESSVWGMVFRAKGAIRVRDAAPKLICWDDVLAWRNDAPLRRDARPWHIESRAHFEARMAGRKDKAMTGSMSERLDR